MGSLYGFVIVLQTLTASGEKDLDVKFDHEQMHQ